MPMIEAEIDDPSPTLASLYGEFGADIFEIVDAPQGLEVPVRGVCIRDVVPGYERLPGSGELVFAVGVAAEQGELGPVLAEAGAAEAAAVVVHSPAGAAGGLIDAAREAGVALIAIPAELTWERLYDLVQAALGVARGPAGFADLHPGASDLFALADATAELAGGPVTIEDTHSRVLAFSRGGQDVDPGRAATILQRHVPGELLEEMRRVDFLQRLHRSTEPLTIKLEGLEERRAIAIHGGGKVMGSIWLAGDAEKLAPDVDDTLRGAARIAAVQLLRRNVMDDVERRLREGRLQALLRGEPAGEGVLTDLELDREAGLVVAAIEVGRPAAADAVALHDRLSGLLRVHLSAYRRAAAVTVMSGRVYVVVACADAQDRSRLRHSLEDGLKRAESVLGEPLHAGLGPWTALDGDPSEMRRGADRALVLGGAPGRVVPYEEVHSRALLADVTDFVAVRGREPSPELHLLLEQDELHGTDYVKTLRAWFDALGDSRAAARRLGVHVNTVRYRVKRARELTGIDFEDGEARFAFELQLRMLAAGGIGGESGER